MRGFVLGVVVTLVVAVLVVLCVVYFGWFPVGADNAPGTLERRLANRAVDAYVEAHAPQVQNPVAPTAANLIQGARDYEAHCSVCHGGAPTRISVLRGRFSPPVPQIINRVPRDPDARLWWVTKHGTRMTAMPSWDGVLTDDQMWRIIAFVKHSKSLPPAVQAAWQQIAAQRQRQEASADPRR